MTKHSLASDAFLLPSLSLVGLASVLIAPIACDNAGEGVVAKTTTTTTTTTTSGDNTSTTVGMTTGSGGMPINPDPSVETVECSGAFPMEDVSAATYRLTAEGSVSWGELPHFWNSFGTGHLGLYLREDRNWGQILREHTVDAVKNLGMERIRSHGLFHDDIGIYDEEDGEPVFDFEASDRIFDFLVDQGIAPIIELGPMPAALASDPEKTVFDWQMGVSPPKDYDSWEELVRQFAQHSLDRYGMDVVSKWDWEVWNEPECCENKFWSGTLQEYFQLYEASAAGVRSVLPQGRVGGPVTSQPVELTSNSRAGILFLDWVTENDSVLDFFSYHSWSFVGGAVDGYFQGLDLLDQYGKNEVGIIISEFGPTWEFGLRDEPQEMHQGAAFAVQSFADISRRVALEDTRWPISYSWWVLSDIFEEGMYREQDPFIGCMGLTTREGIRKPAYNAYKFLAQLGNQQLSLGIEGPGGVGGLAARDERGGIQVIIYNGQNPGNGPSDDQYYDETEAHEIGVTLEGLNPDVAYDVVEYRIDNDHGNAYATWESMGRPAMPDMSEADWQALRDTMDATPTSVGEAICGESFSKSYSLTSPGVLFLTFTPAETAGSGAGGAAGAGGGSN